MTLKALRQRQIIIRNLNLYPQLYISILVSWLILVGLLQLSVALSEQRSSVEKLQLHQRAATVLSCTIKPGREFKTRSVLASLHRLFVKYIIKMKILLIPSKTLHNQLSAYICELLTPYYKSRTWRSCNHGSPASSLTNFKAKGNRIAVVTHMLWNYLSIDIKTAAMWTVLNNIWQSIFW